MNKKLSTQYLLATFTVALFCTQLLVAQSRSVDKVSTPPNKRDNHTSNPSKDLTIRPIDGHAQSTISDDRDSSRPKRPGDEQRDSVDDVKKVYDCDHTNFEEYCVECYTELHYYLTEKNTEDANC